MQKFMSFVASSAPGNPSHKSLDDRRLDQPRAPPAASRSAALAQRTFDTMMYLTARGDDDSFTEYLSFLRIADASHQESSASWKEEGLSSSANLDKDVGRETLSQKTFFDSRDTVLVKVLERGAEAVNLDKDVERDTLTCWDVRKIRPTRQKNVRTPEQCPEDAPRTPEQRPPLRPTLRAAPSAKRLASAALSRSHMAAASRGMEHAEPDVAAFPAPPPKTPGSLAVMRAWASAPVLLRRVSFKASPQVLIIPATRVI